MNMPNCGIGRLRTCNTYPGALICIVESGAMGYMNFWSQTGSIVLRRFSRVILWDRARTTDNPPIKSPKL